MLIQASIFYPLKKERLFFFFFVISTLIIVVFKTVCQFSIPTPLYLLKGIHINYSEKGNRFSENTIAVLILLIKILSHFSNCYWLLALVSSTSSTQQALLEIHFTWAFPLQHFTQTEHKNSPNNMNNLIHLGQNSRSTSPTIINAHQ